MPTYDIVCNIAKGRVGELAALGAANDALIAVVLEATGIESAATLRDYDDLATLLAASNNEQTTMGRKTLAGVTVTIDDTNDWVTVDATDITWTAATGNPTAALVVCYDADTTSGTDSNLIPLVVLDFVTTPSGNDITYVVNAVGFYKAA